MVLVNTPLPAGKVRRVLKRHYTSHKIPFMLVFFPPRVRTSGGFPFYALISIQILRMINYSSERRKSRRTKKRRQSGQIRNESEKFTRGEVYFSPESTCTGYGSIISPIRENWTYPTPTNLFPGPTKMIQPKQYNPDPKQQHNPSVHRYWQIFEDLPILSE